MAADNLERLRLSLGSAYTIERELGGGGMARVFLAEETRLKRRVVVKVLAPDLAAGINADRFEREIQLAASLQQANIVPLLSAGEAEGLPWYTMPFVEGESLRARIDRAGPLPVNETVGILRDVARALDYAHARGVVHRDIKPDNVFLSGGTAVVSDFGIAKALSVSRTRAPGGTLTQLGTSLGTPAYMAPEQAAGDPEVDHRADIYSLGVMAYELLAGVTPFHDRAPQRMLAAHLTEPAPPITSLRVDTPPTLADLVMRCLAKDPVERPQSASEVVSSLETSARTDALAAMPLLGKPGTWKKALGAYAVAFMAVAILARAAVIGLGLPDWVFPGALIVMALGLPVILVTAYVHRAHRQIALATGSRTASGQWATGGGVTVMAAKARPHLTWRRAALGGASALGAFVLVVGGFMLLRAQGIGPAGSLLAAGKLSDDDRVLVADFRVSGADSTLGHIASEAVRTDLGQSEKISVVPASAVSAALQRMQRPPASRLDYQLARELATREGIKAILHGELNALGQGFLIVLRLSAAQSGDELATFRGTADSPQDLVPTLDKLSRKVRGKIGESLKTVRAAPSLEQVTTPSLAALQKYVAGARAADREANYAKAIGLLEEAVRLDTTFAMAYRKLGIAYLNSGLGPFGGTDSALTKAFRFRDRLTDRERLLAEGTYYGSGPGRDRQKAIAAYEALLEIDPKHGGALNNLGILYRSRREFDKAEGVYRRAIALGQATTTAYTNLRVALFSMGKFAAADSVGAEHRKRFPSLSQHPFLDLPALYQQGRVDSVFAVARRLRESSDPEVRANALGLLADLEYGRGRLREARRLLKEGIAAAQARGVRRYPVIYDTLQGAMDDLWYREQPETAIRKLEAVLAQRPVSSFPVDQRPYTGIIALYSLAGKPDRARSWLARMDAEVTDSTLRRALEPARHNGLALIALAERRPRDALTELRLADSYPDGPTTDCTICFDAPTGMVYEMAEMPDSAIAAYERYVKTPYWARMSRSLDATWLPYTHRRLGELYESKGDTTKAVVNYARFLDLWKDADQDLQHRVTDVRRRLERLKYRERT